MKCSFCENEFEYDRYNITLKIERQDAPDAFWQSSYEHARENICPKCFEAISKWFGIFLEVLRNNKGIYPLIT